MDGPSLQLRWLAHALCLEVSVTGRRPDELGASVPSPKTRFHTLEDRPATAPVERREFTEICDLRRPRCGVQPQIRVPDLERRKRWGVHHLL